jgi:hypothetical protein
MSLDHTYIRLTKLRAFSGALWRDQFATLTGATYEGSPDHRIAAGCIMDGWFLEEPRVGRSMVLLRFRRNGLNRLGIFTSSRVTFVSAFEIHTMNSVYQIERLSFDLRQQTSTI